MATDAEALEFIARRERMGAASVGREYGPLSDHAAEGEEVIGAKQNINLTVLVAAGATLELPVSCVEQGRWAMHSKVFAESGRTMHAQARARKMRDVTQSLRTCRVADADQGAVWRDVAERLSAVGAHSPTAALAAAYERVAVDVEACAASFEPEPTQVGAVFALGGRITGAELFDSPDAWRGSSVKVLRGYAIELNAGDVDAAPALEQAARDFLLALCDVNGTVHEGIRAGTHVRFNDGRSRLPQPWIDGLLGRTAAT